LLQSASVGLSPSLVPAAQVAVQLLDPQCSTARSQLLLPWHSMAQGPRAPQKISASWHS
jgi:hypothetical protein